MLFMNMRQFINDHVLINYFLKKLYNFIKISIYIHGYYGQFTTKNSPKATLLNNINFFNRHLSENQFSYCKNMSQLFKKVQLKQACPKS
jgi:hypothetical protein